MTRVVAQVFDRVEHDALLVLPTEFGAFVRRFEGRRVNRTEDLDDSLGGFAEPG